MTETDAYNQFQRENPSTFDGATLGPPKKENEFLYNRLWKTFMAGVAAGRQLERKELQERAARALFG